MGRRPDAPEVQAAKGNPGRRASKVEKRAAELEALARQLSAGPAAPADPASPEILNDPVFSGAKAVWDRWAPEMVRTSRLPLEGRDYFAALCVYTAEYWRMAKEVAERGEFQRVKRTNGSWEEKIRPAVALRDAAFENMLKLSPKFGMTPMDMYSLYKDQAVAAQSNPGLFGKAERPEEPKDAPSGLIGAGQRLRSEPPPTVN